MNALFRAFLIGVLVLPLMAAANQNLWVNNGSIVVATNLNATNVINNGNILGALELSNMRNMTNNGVIQNSNLLGGTTISFGQIPGFRFDTAPVNSSGQAIAPRSLAANFGNRSGARITAVDGLIYKDILLTPYSGSMLQVRATNIWNQGRLEAGTGGLLQLVGTNVNISRGALEITELPGTPSSDDFNNGEFTPSLAVFDLYWGQGEAEYLTASRYLLNDEGLATFSSPIHEVTSGGAAIDTIIQSGFYDPRQYHAAFEAVVETIDIPVTNQMGQVTVEEYPSNVVRQVVFVLTSDTNRLPAEIYFTPSTRPTNFMQTVTVEFAYFRTNFTTGLPVTNYILLTDTLASELPRGFLLNTVDGTERPANYNLSRSTFPTFGIAGGNLDLTNGFLHGPGFESPLLEGEYAGYSAYLDNLTERPTPIPAGTMTNILGRVEVSANSLDMSRARISAEGGVIIKANHLVSSTNAVVDAENLSYDLGSTNGVLRIQGLSKLTTDRLRGNISVWSGLWQNEEDQIIENYDTSSNPVVLVPITNTVAYTFHMLIVDARSLTTIQPTTVHRLDAKADHVIIQDDAQVNGYFHVDGPRFSLLGFLSLYGGVSDWGSAIAPQLRYFTNFGTLQVANTASFGSDGPLNYLAFVNQGYIQSFGQSINSDYVEISGGIHYSDANLDIISQTTVASAANFGAWGDFNLSANNLSFLDQSWIDVAGHVTLDVDGSVMDGGMDGLTIISTGQGFTLSQKPQSGNLLGTTFYSYTQPFANNWHFWAGEDLGNSAAGFSDNAAVGSLVLTPLGFDPLFTFSGTTAGAHAMYVGHLDLSSLEDYANQLEILEGFRIYYSTASLNTNVSGTLTNSVEEFLDGQFGGRLRWVPDFVSNAGSVTITINGSQSIVVSAALANSYQIDSDADGVANALDESPFDGVIINSITPYANPSGFKITWNAAPNTLYRLESSTNLLVQDWELVLTTTSTNSGVGPWSVIAPQVTGPPRYYRVTYSPNP
jgi:hypothetical protein